MNHNAACKTLHTVKQQQLETHGVSTFVAKLQAASAGY